MEAVYEMLKAGVKCALASKDAGIANYEHGQIDLARILGEITKEQHNELIRELRGKRYVKQLENLMKSARSDPASQPK